VQKNTRISYKFYVWRKIKRRGTGTVLQKVAPLSGKGTVAPFRSGLKVAWLDRLKRKNMKVFGYCHYFADFFRCKKLAGLHIACRQDRM
jgi:hypothetical protein